MGLVMALLATVSMSFPDMHWGRSARVPFRGLAADDPLVLFSEDFELGSFDPDKWWATGSGQIVIDPQNPSNRVMQFVAQAEHGDAFTVKVPYHATVKLSFDVLKTTENAYAFIGTDHGFCCDHAQWLWNSEQWAGGGTGGNVPMNQWTHVSITFSPYDGGATRDFAVKLQQSGANPGSPTSIAQSVFFDNILLEIAP